MMQTCPPTWPRTTCGRPFVSAAPRALLACLLAFATLVVTGCEISPEKYEVTNDQATRTFDGPRYLRGTIGSYGSFINNSPRYVGGYGVAVDLNGTGSSEVPAFLREALINEMLRNGLGSVRFGTEQFTPERVLADSGSAVVAVEGLIPPGAVRGTKFDILVSLVDSTSTSLAGGRLFWPTQLSQTGLDKQLLFTETLAAGMGTLFVNPVKTPDKKDTEFQRQAVIVNGGTVLESQTIQFVLNAPSNRMSDQIRDRINERFKTTKNDRLPPAVAKTEGLIEINVPMRFANRPAEFLALIEHLYVDPTPAMIKPQAEQLAKDLLEAPEDRAREISLAWMGLGPNTIPVLRRYYNHSNCLVREAALKAGAALQDSDTVKPLSALALTGTPAQRAEAAWSLAQLIRDTDARLQVREMLNDPDPDVRLGAYESLVRVGDRSVERLSVDDGKAHKFYIDRVPSKYPGVYALQGEDLAIVIFGGDIPLRKHVFAKLDDTLTLRTVATSTIPVGLADRHNGDSAFIPIHACGVLKMIPSLQPVSDDPKAKLPPDDWSVLVADGKGNKMVLNIRSQPLQDAFGKKILTLPNRAKIAKTPHALARVRIVKDAGKDDKGNPTPAVGELVALSPPDARLPLVLRYAQPGKREAKVYRITPTVATLAYTLGYKMDNLNTQFGPDLTFTHVVRALHQLCENGTIPAKFDARISPLAQRIAAAQRDGEIDTRPEENPGDFDGQPDPATDGSAKPPAADATRGG